MQLLSGAQILITEPSPECDAAIMPSFAHPAYCVLAFVWHHRGMQVVHVSEIGVN